MVTCLAAEPLPMTALLGEKLEEADVGIDTASGSESGSCARGQLRWEKLDNTSCTAGEVWLEKVRRLSDAEFHEDALEIVDPGGMWHAEALIDGGELAGFVVYGVLQGSMSLRYIAVAPQCRGRRHGHRLVQRVRERCVVQAVSELCLFCKREMVPFYSSLGFQEVPDEDDGESEDDLQVPMFCRVPLTAEEAARQSVPRVDEAPAEEESGEWETAPDKATRRSETCTDSDD
eukprot:TRINITY_DN35456_c0_g1_i1.p1 TRINITY_DN35456_c0_g1~~TRINITY_DN35456_c0_g1_i1.p1  ORF type:complete len:232 (+),score=44.74 TRINITY_DN35456_c0_g1_i1:67-762(+)